MGDKNYSNKDFIDLYVKVHSSKLRATAFKDGQTLCNSLKKEKDKLHEEICNLKVKFANQNAKLMTFWKNASHNQNRYQNFNDQNDTVSSSSVPEISIIETTAMDNSENQTETEENLNQSGPIRRKYHCPALNSVQKESADLNETYVALMTLKAKGPFSDESKFNWKM